jgi:predicted transcriptional regulator
MYDIELTKYLLRRKGSSFAVAARELGISRAAVTMALKGKFPGSRIIAHLESKIGQLPKTEESQAA